MRKKAGEYALSSAEKERIMELASQPNHILAQYDDLYINDVDAAMYRVPH
jgi:hypothetical protein